MLQLFVLYDADCGLCRRLASWLAEQSALIPLTPIPAQSEQASKLYPNGKGKELAVVSDEGAVWLGDRAWIMCLYALRHYRHWARKLASPCCSRWRGRRSCRSRIIARRSQSS